MVGVVRDAKYATLDEDTPSFAYMPLRHVWHPTQTLLVRTHPNVPASSLMGAVRDAVLAIDPQVPPPRLTTLGELTGIVVLPQRAGAIVTGTLGADGLLLAAMGVIVGLVLAALAARTLAPYLFSVSPFDPLTFVGMSAAFLAVAALASFIPARRAAAADPLDALRQD